MTDVEEPDAVEIVSRLVKGVAASHDEYEAAIADSEDAAADLLEELLKVCADALPALSSLVVGDLRGVVLCSSHGVDLVWTEDGPLALCRREEGWWAAVPAVSVVEEFGEDVVVQAALTLGKSLTGQLGGGKAKATRRIRRRAELLRAVYLLVANLETRELADPEAG